MKLAKDVKMHLIVIFVFLMAAVLHAGVTFKSGSAELTSKSAASLNDLGKSITEAIAKDNSVTVKINGYSDSTGSLQLNMDLSKKRADAVMKYLADKFKIPADKFKTAGLGPNNPIATNATAAGRETNRRVEVEYAGEKVVLSATSDLKTPPATEAPKEQPKTEATLKPPTDITVEGGTLTEGQKGKIQWDGATSKYNLQLSKVRDFASLVADEEVQNTSRDVVLQKGTYYARVASIDANGAKSSYSEVKEIICNAAPVMEEKPVERVVEKAAPPARTESRAGAAVTKNYQIGYEHFIEQQDGSFFAAAFLDSGWGIRYYSLLKSANGETDSDFFILKKGIISGRLDYEIGAYDISLRHHEGIPYFAALSYNLCKEGILQSSLNLEYIEEELRATARIGLGWDK